MPSSQEIVDEIFDLLGIPKYHPETLAIISAVAAVEFWIYNSAWDSIYVLSTALFRRWAMRSGTSTCRRRRQQSSKRSWTRSISARTLRAPREVLKTIRDKPVTPGTIVPLILSAQCPEHATWNPLPLAAIIETTSPTNFAPLVTQPSFVVVKNSYTYGSALNMQHGIRSH
jgi:hypothetical protein